MHESIGSLVGDRSLVVLESTARARDSVRVLLDQGRVAAPVRGESGALVGVVSIRDLLRAGHEDTVALHTRLGLLAANADESLVDVRHRLLASRHAHLLVKLGDEPIAFFDGLDLARHAVA